MTDQEHRATRQSAAPDPPDHIGPVAAVAALAGAFFVLWSAVAFAFLTITALGLANQHAAEDFTPVEATLEKSELGYSHNSGGGSTTWLDLEYTYTVDNTDYTATSYSLAASRGMWLDREKRDFVDRHPAGSTITAYHDPDNPARAVLSREVAAADYFLLLILTAFAIVGLAGLLVPAAALRVAIFKPPFAGKQVKREARNRYRVRLARRSPAFVAAATAVAAAFVAIVTVGVFVLPNNPSPEPVIAAIAASLAAGLVAWAYKRARVTNADADVIIDNDRQQLTLPDEQQGDTSLSIDLDDIDAINIRTRKKSLGKGKGTAEVHRVEVVARDQRGNRTAHRVIEWHDHPRAHMFARDLAAFTDRPLRSA